jgi:hypothetical protein
LLATAGADRDARWPPSRHRRASWWVVPQNAIDPAEAAIPVPSLWPGPRASASKRPSGRRPRLDAGGIADWLTDGENGRLIDPRRARPALRRLRHSRGPGPRRRLAAGARAAAARLSLEAYAGALMRPGTSAAPAAIR